MGRECHVENAKIRLSIILKANQDLKQQITNTRRSAYKTKQALAAMRRQVKEAQQELEQIQDRTSDHQQSRERVRNDLITLNGKLRQLEQDARKRRLGATKQLSSNPKSQASGKRSEAWGLGSTFKGESADSLHSAEVENHEFDQHQGELFITQLFARTTNIVLQKGGEAVNQYEPASSSFARQKRVAHGIRKLSANLGRLRRAASSARSARSYNKNMHVRLSFGGHTDSEEPTSLTAEQLLSLRSHVEHVMENLNTARAGVILAEQEFEQTLSKKGAVAEELKSYHAATMRQKQEAREQEVERQQGVKDWSHKVENLRESIRSRNSLLERCKEELLRIQNVLDPASYQHNFRQGVKTSQIREVLSALEARVFSVRDAYQRLKDVSTAATQRTSLSGSNETATHRAFET
eukprot:scaffold334_cov241-Pinguiococcus_pyrenoidosus.AAC.9